MTATDEPIIPLYRYVDPRTVDINDPVQFAALCEAYRREMHLRDLDQVYILLLAGWTFELPGGPNYDADLMSWYWRAPPKRKGGRGRKYLSTNQAINALVKMTPKG